MRAGRLRYRVTIEQPAETVGGTYGDVKRAPFSPFAQSWAAIVPLAGRELMLAQQINSEITVRIELRYLAGVTAKMRVAQGTNVYEIIAPPINVEMRNRELHLMCRQAPGGAS